MTVSLVCLYLCVDMCVNVHINALAVARLYLIETNFEHFLLECLYSKYAYEDKYKQRNYDFFLFTFGMVRCATILSKYIL